MRTPSTIQLTLIKPVLCVGHYLVQMEQRGGGGREEEQRERGKDGGERGKEPVFTTVHASKWY